MDPALVLTGARPRLLDDWQVAPALWNLVRRAVDGSGQPGQFLLTGSAFPTDDTERHTEARRATLAADPAGADGGLDERTVADYLQALERLMVIEPQPTWAPHLRSRARLRRAPKRYFVDPSLALAALGSGPERLLADLEWSGLLFVSLVIRDLRVLCQPLDGEVFH